MALRQEWSAEDVVGAWTLVETDWDLVGNKTGATRLGFALLVKLFEQEARFPVSMEQFPAPAVECVAGLVKVPASALGSYGLSSRTATNHRSQIREV